ncbi:hypothetical protein VII00023_20512 [Vibrio ichthyoenteri ATCC 700023]|uniref:Uncharacterized protein n=1 Tax=Vibrio ichthyoenteri ATCC 700023 TaxID=870968 RepID=F9S7R5_9VIBR|nr:hypothetical protein [Vibrio ichthyoenteri]EGU30965.1 hypothetical protein VII00023_20512 [Vibrio ichthyoenteri ATCC 700023]
MKKFLLIPLVMLAFNASAKDIQDMSKGEVKAYHAELYEKAMNNTTLENCQKINRFYSAALKQKKLVLMDIKEGSDWAKARQLCSHEVEYDFFADKSLDYK